ncbi:MAG: cytochrome c [Bacteroidota bacterium]|nr:cytochrome c [Bacteroidota bacterium]MDP4230433.1 cytochrome c [Bacteroidota bacterium]
MKRIGIGALLLACSAYLFGTSVVSSPAALHEASKELATVTANAEPAAHSKTGKKIVFTKNIAPLIYANCTACHRPGQVAPFSLMTYEDVRRHSKEIVELTGKREMPPWKAKHGYGEFQGERRLKDSDIKMIAQWVKAGMALGEEKDLPPLPDYPDAWQMGTPDLVVYMPEALTIPPNNPDFFISFVIPLNLPEDKYIRAMDILPSNRRVVHHTTLLMDSSGKARIEEEKVMRGEMRRESNPSAKEIMIGGWAPGGRVRPYPEGLARRLPKNADLILETHFHPTGKIEVERTAIGLYFADKKQPKEPVDIIFSNINIDLPANTVKVIKIDRVLDNDLTVFGIAGHAHFLCKDIKVHAILPDKTDVPLLWIPDWDFNWQEQYRYEKPLHLPKGTRVLADFTFDNTYENIHNPNSPPIHVRYGGESTNEMANIMLNTIPN